MINKELKYREEMFKLLRNNLDPENDNPELMKIIKDAFIEDNIEMDDFIKKFLIYEENRLHLHIKGEGKTYDPRPEFINPTNNSNNKIFEITVITVMERHLSKFTYALEADKLDEAKILPLIRNSITRYDNDDSYELEYNINLELPGGKELKLLKEKKEVFKLDDGPPIGHANLHNELSVIYDVPTNPSERLNAVIKDLGQ